MQIITTSGYGELSRRAAAIIAAQVTLKPDSVLGLATGSTPEGAYDLLARWHTEGDLDFSRVTTVNLDEYCGLAPDHPQSYRYFMDKHLFTRVNIQRENTYLPLGQAADVRAECGRYDALIQSLGGVDLQLLGIGNNGHIGFNEPGDAFVMDTHCTDLSDNTVAANARFFAGAEQVPKRAVTMGVRHIMQAKKILLVVSGPAKKDIFERALYGPVTPAVPASILQMHLALTVVVNFTE